MHRSAPPTILNRLSRARASADTARLIILRFDDPDFERLQAEAHRLEKMELVTMRESGLFSEWLVIEEVPKY